MEADGEWVERGVKSLSEVGRLELSLGGGGWKGEVLQSQSKKLKQGHCG